MHEMNTTRGGTDGIYGSGHGVNRVGFHTFDTDGAAKLGDPARFRFISWEELLSHFGVAPERVVVDLGSGTGFFTDEVVPRVGTLCAIDMRAIMCDYYREKSTPDNAEFVTADMASLPFGDGHLDAVFSMMTYHEFATDEALAELVRVVRPGGTVVVVDWSISDSGEDGPSRNKRPGLGSAVSTLEAAGFTVIHGETRHETSICAARRWYERTREATPLKLNSKPCRS